MTAPKHGFMKKCPYCAEEIQEDAIKCKHCGEKVIPPLSNLNTGSGSVPSAVDPKNLRPGQIVGLLFLAGTLLVGLLVFFNSDTSSNPLSNLSQSPLSELQGEVRRSIEQTWASQTETRSNKVRNFTLVHKSENQYDGLLEAEVDKKPISISVDVTYDGRKFMWKIRSL